VGAAMRLEQLDRDSCQASGCAGDRILNARSQFTKLAALKAAACG
jgi:hypothetical protein